MTFERPSQWCWGLVIALAIVPVAARAETPATSSAPTMAHVEIYSPPTPGSESPGAAQAQAADRRRTGTALALIGAGVATFGALHKMGEAEIPADGLGPPESVYDTGNYLMMAIGGAVAVMGITMRWSAGRTPVTLRAGPGGAALAARVTF